MKTKSALLAGILVLIVGIALIFFHRDITSSAVVITGGSLFCAAGVLNIAIMYLYKNDEGQRRIRGVPFGLAVAVSAAAIILGICVLCFQPTFTALTPLVFGSLVTLVTIVLFYMLAIGTRPVILPGWLYIFPTLCAVGAVMIFLLYKSGDAQVIRDERMILYTGISLCLYAVCAIIGSICLATAHHRERKAAKEAAAEKASSEVEHADKPEVRDTSAKTAETTTAEKVIKPLDDNN